MGSRSKTTVAAAAAVLVVAAVVAGIALRPSNTMSGTGTPAAGAHPRQIVFVHGSGCGAIQYTTYAIHELEAMTARPAAAFHTVAYYACDTGGESILNEGSSSYLPSPDHDGVGTDIRRIAYELAWYLWNNFGSKGDPVDLVGHSMGGIVITYALQHIATHDPAYPKALMVRSVTTFSSPFAGVPPTLCAATDTVECRQLLPGSGLLHQLAATGAVALGTSTAWTLVGSDGADEVPSTSALALPRATYRVDYRSPAYTHAAYLLDATLARTARGELNGGPFTTGYHSLDMLAHELG